jgi:hypothetical protein
VLTPPLLSLWPPLACPLPPLSLGYRHHHGHHQLIVIPNQNLFKLVAPTTSLMEVRVLSMLITFDVSINPFNYH